MYMYNKSNTIYNRTRSEIYKSYKGISPEYASIEPYQCTV